MSTPLSPCSVKILEVLADGKPHTYDELVAIAGPLIAPGRAARHAATARARLRSHRGGAGQPLREQEAVDVGRRSLVVRTIISLRRTGRITTTAGTAQIAGPQ